MVLYRLSLHFLMQQQQWLTQSTDLSETIMVASIVILSFCVCIETRCVWKQKASKIEMFVLLLFVFYFFKLTPIALLL